MKTVFVIAGLDIEQTAKGDTYKHLCNVIKEKGYKVVPVDISWRRKTPTQFVYEFVDFYNQKKGDYNLILGNSFGAVVTLIGAPIIKPDEILLCSVSPFFSEDTKREKLSLYVKKLLGHRRLDDIAAYSSKQLCGEINQLDIQAKVFYGEKEHISSPELVVRTKEISNLLKNSQLFELPDTPHSFEDPAYTKGIAAQL